MSSISIRVGTEGAGSPPRPTPETPFEIWVLGDFSGRGSRGVQEAETLGQRVAVQVDRDDLESRFARLDVRCAFPGWSEAPPEVAFPELDALHPDVLYQEIELFAQLRGLKRRLLNPDTFHAAATELGAVVPESEAPPSAPATASPARENPPAEEAGPTSGSLLDAAIAATPQSAAAPTRKRGIEAWLDEVVAPFVIPAPDPRRDSLVDAVDEGAAMLLRRLLHAPAFRQLEARWLGLKSLAYGLETDRHLVVRLLDVTEAELQADLEGAGDLAATGAYELLVTRAAKTPGAPRPALIVSDLAFRVDPLSIELLFKLSAIAREAGAVLLAAADTDLVEALVGEGSDAAGDGLREAWSAFRASAPARACALVHPRLLQRLPYGKRGGTVEALALEEAPAPHDPSALPWGSAAFAAALLTGRSFTSRGWSLEPLESVIDGQPLYVYADSEGDQELQSCGESVVTESVGERLAEIGISPVWSVLGTDQVRIGPLRTLTGERLGVALGTTD